MSNISLLVAMFTFVGFKVVNVISFVPENIGEMDYREALSKAILFFKGLCSGKRPFSQ